MTPRRLFHAAARCLARFARRNEGSVTVTSAFALIGIMGLAALAVDGGSLYYRKRVLQTATDLAALAAAGDMPNARKAAIATLTANGIDASSLANLEFGTYTAASDTAPAQRFKPSAPATANAVRLTVTEQRRTAFAPVAALALGPGGGQSWDYIPIRTAATATSQNTAAFTLGSRLLSLDGGAVNALLGGLLGTNISLSALDYNALANAKVDLFKFSNALANRLQLGAVSYEKLLEVDTRPSLVFTALADVSSGQAAEALRLLSAQTAGQPPSGIMKNLLSVVPYKGLQVSGTGPVDASMNVMGIVSAVAQIGNGNRMVDVAVPVTLPGIAEARLRLAVGERPVGAAAIAVGPEGTSVHSAQVRLLVTVKLIGTGAVPMVSLPLYVEVAAGTARISAISCPAFNPADATVTLGVTPAVVDAWIGDVSMAEFRNMRVKPNPPAATLVSLLGIATINGRAHVAVTNMRERAVVFTAADIRAGLPKTVSTGDFTTSLVTLLLRDLQLSLNTLGLPGLLPPGLLGLVTSILTYATGPVDQLLRMLLGTLGIELGSADVWVNGVRCGQPVLIG